MARRYGGRYPQRKAERATAQPEAWGYSPLEKEIAGQIIQALRTIGCHVSSTQQSRASRQTIGMPDLFASHDAWGVFAWIEVKTPDGRVSKSQAEWHERTMAADCPVLVVTSAADALQQFGALPRRRHA